MKYKIILLPQVKSTPVNFWVGKQYKQEAPLLIISYSSNTITQVNCTVFWERVQLHNNSEKFTYTAEEDCFQGFNLWKAFPYFSFLSSLYSDLKLLSLDEGCWVFSHLGFPGQKYLCYCFVLCLSSSDPIDKCN